MKRDLAGMALPLVLLLLLALTTFGHAALVLSQREVQASAAYRDLVRAEKAAGVGLRLGLSVSPDPFGDRSAWVAQPLLSGELIDGLTYSAIRRWIDREFFVIQGIGGVKGWPGERVLGALGWTLHPGARLASFLAAAEVGSEVWVHERSTLSTDGFFSIPEGWSSGLGEEIGTRAKGIFRDGPIPGVVKKKNAQDTTGIPGLGLLSGAALLLLSRPPGDHASTELGGGGAGCPGSGERPLFLSSTGPLSLPRGRTCGLVVTGGDLRVGTGTVFQGLVLTGGDLVIETDGRVEGMARVANDLVLKPGAVFLGASIPSLWALEGISRLHYPIPVLSGPFSGR